MNSPEKLSSAGTTPNKQVRGADRPSDHRGWPPEQPWLKVRTGVAKSPDTCGSHAGIYNLPTYSSNVSPPRKTPSSLDNFSAKQRGNSFPNVATSPPQLGNISLNSFLNVSIPSVCAEIAFPVLNASIFEIHFPLFPQYNLSASSTSNPWFTFFPTMLTSTGTPFFFEYVIAI